MTWLHDLPYDPVEPLLQSGHTAVAYWTRRELLNENIDAPAAILWNLKIPKSILHKQNKNGSWTYPAKKQPTPIDYDQLETYRQLGFLIEMFGFSRMHPAVQRAAEYLFSCQSSEGDFRGIYAKQYTPNYTAAFLELLVEAGYQNDARIEKVFAWLDSVRQNDGGWALAFRTHGNNLDIIYDGSDQLTLDRSWPLSHFVTGVVLRAYAAHPTYRRSDVAVNATRLLTSRLFERDVYPDRNRVDDWTRFSFPFWQTDILSSLDTIGLIEPTLGDEAKVVQAKQWFIDHQQSDGLFTGHLLKDRYHDLQLWYSYAVCRALNRFSNS